jgi:23S rRNA (adenine2503-C2)-methyltransferase
VSEKPLFYDLSYEQLADQLADWGEPSYRSEQIWRGIYERLESSPRTLTTLPLDLRDRLLQRFDFQAFDELRCLKSADGETTKFHLRLRDGQDVESVLMRYERRRTACISTQAGCAMGCVFCATGQMGFLRHLSSGEIVEQVLHIARMLEQEHETLTNVVVMGMGEPFHNYEATLEALNRLNDSRGFNFGARRFTVSTVGVVPMIRRFMEEDRQYNLAVSLHAATDELRSQLLPVNRRYPLDLLMQACRAYVRRTHRRITFEWALIEGVNDDVQQAHALAQQIAGMLCHVNLIPLNPTSGYGGEGSAMARAQAFCQVLTEAGISCTIRARKGIEIEAGCGQLATEKKPSISP